MTLINPILKYIRSFKTLNRHTCLGVFAGWRAETEPFFSKKMATPKQVCRINVFQMVCEDRVNKCSKSGMTLIEAVVWIVVFAISMLAIAVTVISLFRSSGFTIRAANDLASVQRGMDDMMNTLRKAQYASNGAYPIVSASSSDIVFYASTVPGNIMAQRVHYYISGTSLMKGIIEPSGVPYTYNGAETVTKIADDVVNVAKAMPMFYYYKANATELIPSPVAMIGDVRFIKMQLFVNSGSTANTEVMLTASAMMRNIWGD